MLSNSLLNMIRYFSTTGFFMVWLFSDFWFVKIGDKCIKFYNTERDNIKSIFKLLKNGEEINIGSLRKQDFAIIKLALMRNKNCLRLIFEVILEIIKACGKFRDTVFLKNTITIDPKKDKELNLLWTIKSYEELVSDETINISIIWAILKLKE